MKDYSFKINGRQYNVSIDDVNEESTVANVVVNGTPYQVETRVPRYPQSRKRRPQLPRAAATQAVSAARPAAQAAPKSPLRFRERSSA